MDHCTWPVVLFPSSRLKVRKRPNQSDLDALLSSYDTTVIALKLKQVAEFVRTLEKKLAQAQILMRATGNSHLPPDSVANPERVEFWGGLFSATGNPPTYLSQEWEAIKKESRPLLAEMGRHFKVFKDNAAQALASKPDEASEQKTQRAINKADHYHALYQAYLQIWRGLRERLTWELNSRSTGKDATPFARDKAARDKRIHELQKLHSNAGPAALWKIAVDDPVIKQILSQGNVDLDSKETIRNVLKPRKPSNSQREFTASRKNPRKF